MKILSTLISHNVAMEDIMIETSSMSDIEITRRRGEYASALSPGITAGRLVFERGTANDVIVVDHDMPELFVARFDRPVPR